MVHKKDNIEMEILLVLIKGENHLREISRILDVPHSTILRFLNNLLEENILDYKFQGKNKVFFIKKNIQAKNYVFRSENYKLIQLFRKYPELKVISEQILKKANKNLLIFFGSYAKFIAKKESDIDIYLDSTNKKLKQEIEQINSMLSVKLGKFDNSSFLIKEIIKSHVVLKGVEDFYEKTKFFE